MTSLGIIKALKALLFVSIVAVPLVYFPYSMYPFNIPKVVLFQSLVEIMVGLWLGLIILDRRYLPRKTPLLFALVVLLGTLILSSIFGIDPFRSFWSTIDRGMGIVGLLHFAAFALMIRSIADHISWRKVWWASFGTAIAVGLIAVIQKTGDYYFILYQSSDRPGSTLGGSSFMAGYLLFHIFIGGWLFATTERKLLKAIVGIGILLQTAAIFGGQTVGNLIGLFVGFLIITLYYAFRSPDVRLRRACLALAALAVFFVTFLFLTRTYPFWQKIPGVRRVASFTFTQSDVFDRSVAWRAAWNGFKERPLLGWGFENFNVVFNKNYDPNLVTTSFEGTYFDKPHNVFLEYLVTGGILGFFAYIFFLGTLFRSLFKSADHTIRLWFGTALVTYIIQNIVIFDTIGTYFILFLAVAFLDFNAAGASVPTEEQRGETKETPSRLIKCVAGLPLLAAVIPVAFLNGRIALGSYNYYWGINYFLNRLTTDSVAAWHKSFAIGGPYVDYAKKDFASLVQQGLRQRVEFPFPEQLQKEAVQNLKDVIADHPHDYFYYSMLGDFYVNFASYGGEAYIRGAEEAITRAIELSPKRQQLYYILAKIELLKKNPEGAKKFFETAVTLNPNAADPHFYFGVLLYQLGDVAGGDREIARAESLGRKPSTVYEAITLAGFMADLKHDYTRAAEYLEQGISYASDIGLLDVKYNAQLKLGLAYYYGGKSDKARDVFERLLNEIDLKHDPIWPNLEPILRELHVKVPVVAPAP